MNGKEKYSAKKLCATFEKRKKYVTHYMNLKTYLTLGLKLTKVHRVLRFKQTTFLKTYIDICTEMRAEAKTDFGKRLMKLFANR